MGDVHRLEVDEKRPTGLILKKNKTDDSVFKIPQVSKLGLDKLAAQARSRKESGILLSFKDNDEEDDTNNQNINSVSLPDDEDTKFKQTKTTSEKDSKKQYTKVISDSNDYKHKYIYLT